MKQLLLSTCLLLGISALYSAENQSFVLIGKDNARAFLTACIAYKTDYFGDQIDDVGEGKPYQFHLDLPYANKDDLAHIRVYAAIRADAQSNENKQNVISEYISGLSGNELRRLVESARMLFYSESVPLFLLSPLCKRMEQEDKTFPYSQLPRKVQDAMLKVLMEKDNFAEKYRNAPKYWS